MGLALLAGAALARPAPARALEIVEGRQRALYEIDDPEGRLFTPDLACGPFRQRVLQWTGSRRLLAIELELAGTLARGPAGRAPASQPDGSGPLAELAVHLAAGKPPLLAVRAIAGWVGEHIAYAPPTGVPEDAAAVLAARTGSCQGRTSLALALAAAAGLEARSEHGLHVVPGRTEFHRWPVFRAGPEEWIMAEPGRTLDYVDCRHIVATLSARPGEAPPADPAALGISVALREWHDDMVAVDWRPEPAAGRARRADRFQHAGALVVTAGPGWPPGTELRLAGPGGRRRAVLGDGRRAGIVGLAGGTYRLSLAPGPAAGAAAALRERAVQVAPGRLTRIQLPAFEEVRP